MASWSTSPSTDSYGPVLVNGRREYVAVSAPRIIRDVPDPARDGMISRVIQANCTRWNNFQRETPAQTLLPAPLAPFIGVGVVLGSGATPTPAPPAPDAVPGSGAASSSGVSVVPGSGATLVPADTNHLLKSQAAQSRHPVVQIIDRMSDKVADAPTTWPQVKCSTPGCDTVGKWNKKFLSEKVWVHFQETRGDEDDNFTWKYTCVRCIQNTKNAMKWRPRQFLPKASRTQEMPGKDVSNSVEPYSLRMSNWDRACLGKEKESWLSPK